MANEVQQKAMDVWRATFSDGQEVVMEDDQGDFHFGRLKNFDWGIQLFRIGGKKMVEFKWKEIVFIAQSGFPVQGIMGMSYDEAVFLCDSTPTEIIREKLIELAATPKPKPEPEVIHHHHETEVIKSRPYRSPHLIIGGGCPFVFEDVFVKNLINAGNNGPQHWGSWTEEELVLQSRDGAIMHSYDLSHLFFFDGLEKQLDVPVYDRPMAFHEKAW